MATQATRTPVKIVGSKGQIVPENELWIHQPKAREDLRRALDWTQRHPPKESDSDAVLKGLERGRRSKQEKGSAGER